MLSKSFKSGSVRVAKEHFLIFVPVFKQKRVRISLTLLFLKASAVYCRAVIVK